jgi:hypothetical protein
MMDRLIESLWATSTVNRPIEFLEQGHKLIPDTGQTCRENSFAKTYYGTKRSYWGFIEKI